MSANWREAQRPLVAYSIEEAGPAKRDRVYQSPIADAVAGKDTARIPAWFLQIIIIILVVVVVMLYFNVRDLKEDMKLQQTYIHDTRERLAEHGWKISP